jgi:hypothetical protein
MKVEGTEMANLHPKWVMPLIGSDPISYHFLLVIPYLITK